MFVCFKSAPRYYEIELGTRPMRLNVKSLYFVISWHDGCNDVRRDIPVPANTNKVGGISTVSRYLLIIREITKLLRNNIYTTI